MQRVIIYPAYLDSKKTVAEGRRIPKDKGFERPYADDICNCVTKGLNMEAVLEGHERGTKEEGALRMMQDKRYSRDWLTRGRVRVKLKNDDGSPCNPQVTSRRELLLKVAELLPRLKKPRRPVQLVPAAAGPSDAGPSSVAKPASGKAKGSNKVSTKSNKKKRK